MMPSPIETDAHTNTHEDPWAEVGAFVEAFESALDRSEPADLGAFAPGPDHPRYLAVLCELVRVDLEWRWNRGERPPLDEYRTRFPDLFADPILADEVAFEADRLQRQAKAEVPAPRGSDRPADPIARAATLFGDFRIGNVLGFDDAIAAGEMSQEHADLFRGLHRTDPRLAERFARAVSTWPEAGSDFLGFRLDAELGRGTFGRVFLARQGDLADRPVALKVAPDMAGESRVLAQLRHTNIVPIYSIHRGGAFQAVCMPYLGSTTLADVIDEIGRHPTLPDSGQGLLGSLEAHRKATSLPPSDGKEPNLVEHRAEAEANPEPGPPRLAGRSPGLDRLRGLGYVDAVLWVGLRLAEGLVHSHDRGILHRDLKPANVLFGDDGEPMLLDFNLAADTKRLSDSSVAMVGGTLPYMAPEQLSAFAGQHRVVDARADLYSLGVILFQLLTGQAPFEIRRGKVDDVLRQMVDDRLVAPRSVRAFSPSTSPAVAEIVRRLLEPDPRRRYQSASDLREDLQRHLDDLPLLHTREPSVRERARKWARRHPRLSSSTSVALMAVALVAALGWALWARGREVARLEAVESLHRLDADRDRVELTLEGLDARGDQAEEGVALCRQALGRIDAESGTAWLGAPSIALLSATDRRRARLDAGDLLFFWARSLRRRAEASSTESRRPLIREAARVLDRSEAAYDPADRPRAWWTLRADLARLDGQDAEARRLLDRASEVAIDSPRAQFLEAGDRIERGGFDEILPGLEEACRSEPTSARGWLILGDGHAALGRSDEARRCYAAAASLQPKWPWVYLRRGLLELEGHRFTEAEADFDRLLDLRPNGVDGRINRGLARLGRDDAQGAVDDLTVALARPDAPARAWLIRAAALDRLGRPEAASLDRDEGRRRTPEDDAGWVARGLSRLPGDPAAALADVEQALTINPRSFTALQDKAAILSDHLGRTADAVAVLDRAIGLHPGAVAARSGRGVLLARLGRRGEAIEDARIAQKLDSSPETLYQLAGVFALTSKANPEDLREALRLLAASIGRDPRWLKVVPKDPDLDPIRTRPEFLGLIEALAAFGPPGEN